MIVDQRTLRVSKLNNAPSSISNRVSLFNYAAFNRLHQVTPDGDVIDIGFPNKINYVNYQWDCDSLNTTVAAPGWHAVNVSSGTVTLANTGITTGTPTNTQALNIEQHPGVISINSGATVGGGSYLTWGNASARLGVVPGLIFDAVVYLPTVTNNNLRIGIQNSTSSANPTDGIYFDKTATNSWTVRVRSNNVQLLNGSTGLWTASANVWYHFQLFVLSNTSIFARVYNDTGTVFSSSYTFSNLPINSTAARISCFCQVASVGNMLQVDFMRFATHIQRGALN